MVRRVAARAAGLAAQQARQEAAGRLAARHQERLAQLGHRVQVARQVVHPVAGPAQLWAAPLGADPDDLSQWVHLGEAMAQWQEAPVSVEVPDRGLWQLNPVAPVELPAMSDLEAGARWARREVTRRRQEALTDLERAAGLDLADLRQERAADPVRVTLEQVAAQVRALWQPMTAALAGVDWYQAVRQAVADLDPVHPVEPHLEVARQEEDRCPVGLARAGLAGVLVPRGAEGLGLCPCPRCRRQ